MELSDFNKSSQSMKKLVLFLVFTIGLIGAIIYFKSQPSPEDVKVAQKTSNRLLELRVELEDKFKSMNGKHSDDWDTFSREFRPKLNRTMASAAEQLKFSTSPQKNSKDSIAFNITSYAQMLSLMHSVMTEVLKTGAGQVSFDDMRKKLDVHETVLRESNILEAEPTPESTSPAPEVEETKE